MVNARGLTVGLGGALVILLATGRVEAPSPAAVGGVVALSGRATVTRALGSVAALQVGDRLYAGDIVETRRDARARIVLDGRVTVTVRSLSRLHIGEEQRVTGARYSVDLLLSRVRASLRRVLLREPQRIKQKTRHAVASVRG